MLLDVLLRLGPGRRFGAKAPGLPLPRRCRPAGPPRLAARLGLGAVVYPLKRPNPSPQWFGFHEVFHAMTIMAYLTQYAAVSLIVYRAT